MISSLTSTFGRDFLVAFFLPVFLFFSALLGLALFFERSLLESALWKEYWQSAWAVPAALVVLWVISGFLLVLNRSLIMLLEGYPFPRLAFLERYRFDRLQSRIESANEANSDELEQEFRRRFPPSKEWVLPTQFGNAMRAFEVYSFEIYGLDAVPVWNRLLLLLPEQARKVLDSSKATMDFFVNSFYLSLLLFVLLAIYAIRTAGLPPLLLLGVLLVSWMSYWGSISAARDWGEEVKPVFDLYRHELLEKMGLDPPSNWEEEKECWKSLSRTFVYWSPLSLPRAKSHPQVSQTVPNPVTPTLDPVSESSKMQP